MRLLLLLSLFLLSNLSIDAQAELVHEFFPGSDGTTIYTDFTGTFNQETSVKVSDDIILFSAKGELGLELHKIDKGQLTVVKDLKIGEESSTPQYLTVFEDVIYFIAEGDSGARIYRTNGTSEGTEIAFQLGDVDTKSNDFSELLVGRDDRLYFEYNDNIYTYQNDILTQVMHTNSISAGGSFNQNDYKWALYKDGVVVLDVFDGVLYLLSIIDNVVEELATVPWDGGFDRHFGIESFEGGVFFSIESFDEQVMGHYVFLESTGSVNKIGSGGNIRSEYLSDNSCVVSGYDGGTYIFNSSNPEGLEIHDDFGPAYSGANWERERLFEGLLFVGAGGTFDDNEILFYENNSTTANLVHTTDNMSSMKTDGSYTFYFGESELGDKFDDEDLFAFNHDTKEVSPIKTLFDTPFNTNITPLGVIDEELYFFAKLDNEIGLELYKIDLGFRTAVEAEEIDKITLKNLGNNAYVINYKSNKPLYV